MNIKADPIPARLLRLAAWAIDDEADNNDVHSPEDEAILRKIALHLEAIADSGGSLSFEVASNG